MICSLITILSLIELTCSSLFVTHHFDNANRGKISETTVERFNALGLPGYENQQAHSLNHLIQDLDESHVTRISESNKEGPYFWENESFKGNTHVGWKAIDEEKRKRSQYSVTRKVQIAQKECLEMRRNLESHKELKQVLNRATLSNAHSALDLFLERILDTLMGLRYPAKQENRVVKTLEEGGSPDERLWNYLLSEIHESIGELEDILLNFHAQYDNSKKEHFHTFITQALIILNFFMKNDLVEENSIKELINKGKIQNMISIYIINMFNPKKILDLEFHDCIMKSESTKELVLVFKLFEEGFLQNVEYWLLKMRINSLGEKLLELPHEVRKSVVLFNYDPFGKGSRVDLWMKENVIKSLIDYFNTPAFYQWGLRKDYTHGLIYHMMCFVMRCHPEEFKKSLGDAQASHSLSLKMKIIDSALRWLRSTREIDFIGSKGFWTTKPHTLSSEDHLPLKQLGDFKPVFKNELGFFKNNFGCYTSRDFDTLDKVFKDFSLKRIQSSNIQSAEGVIQKYNVRKGIAFFGFQYKSERQVKVTSQRPKTSIEHYPVVSKAFLGDLYSWMQRLKIMFQNNGQNEKIWNKIIQKVSSGREPTITEEVKKWFENSQFITVIIDEIDDNVKDAEYSWEKMISKMEILNHIYYRLDH